MRADDILDRPTYPGPVSSRTSGGTPATQALARAGVPHTVHRYEHDPRAAATVGGFGLEAASALGVLPARVYKTLVVSATTGADRPRLAVAVLPVAQRLDLKAVAAALAARRAVMADPGLAERATGYVVGGISPLGQRRRLPTVVDVSALAHETLLVSAGRRGLDVEVAPADLIRLTGATTADLTVS